MDTDRKQLAEHGMKILDHGSEETLTGVLIRNLCEGTSIECGRGGNVWDLKPSESPWVHHSWVWNTLQALELSDLSIENDLKSLELWKDNDHFLMDDIFALREFTPVELEDINVVRMFMKVCTFSDITTADRKEIRLDILDGEQNVHSISSAAYEWPNVKRPPRSFFVTWNRALRRVYTQGFGVLVKDEYQNTTSWQEPSRKHHKWWVSVHENRLFMKQGDDWRICTIRQVQRQTRATRHTFTSTQDLSVILPYDAVPATVISIRTQIRVTGLSTMADFTTPGNLAEYNWQKYGWPTQKMVLPDDDGEEFTRHIQRGQGKSIFDGSFKNGKSSSAFKSMNDQEVQ